MRKKAKKKKRLTVSIKLLQSPPRRALANTTLDNDFNKKHIMNHLKLMYVLQSGVRINSRKINYLKTKNMKRGDALRKE